MGLEFAFQDPVYYRKKCLNAVSKSLLNHPTNTKWSTWYEI